MTGCRNGSCGRPATKEIELRAGFRVDWRPVCTECAARLASLYPVQRPLDPDGPAWLRRARENGRGLPPRVERRGVA